MIVIYCTLSSAPETIPGPWGPKVRAIKYVSVPRRYLCLGKEWTIPLRLKKNESKK